MPALQTKRFTAPKTQHTYSYTSHTPSAPQTSTLLFLHGFPTTRSIWRDQIAHFLSHGQGVIAPDLRGLGARDSPTNDAAYVGPIQAEDLASLLENEGFGSSSNDGGGAKRQVHGIGHDAGAYILSRLYNYHPHVLKSVTLISVPYSPPGMHFDLDAMGAMSAKMFNGVDKFGYMRFLASEEAPSVVAGNVGGFMNIAFNEDVERRGEWFYPPGKLEEWLREGKREGEVLLDREMEGDWMEAFGGIGDRGWRGATAGYRVMEGNLNQAMEKGDLEEGRVRVKLELPVLAIDSAPDKLSLAGLIEKSVGAYLGEKGTLVVKTAASQGHYPHISSPDEVNKAIEEFVRNVDDAQ
jgi:soluble epoxide hydrolase / lipid-phosphate phosphatase